MLSELTCVSTQSCELIVWVGPVRVWADVFAMTPEVPSSVAHDIYRVAVFVVFLGCLDSSSHGECNFAGHSSKAEEVAR